MMKCVSITAVAAAAFLLMVANFPVRAVIAPRDQLEPTTMTKHDPETNNGLLEEEVVDEEERRLRKNASPSSCRACAHIMNASLKNMAKCTQRCSKRAKKAKNISAANCDEMCAASAGQSVLAGAVPAKTLAKHACAAIQKCRKKFLLPAAEETTLPDDNTANDNDSNNTIRIDPESWISEDTTEDGAGGGGPTYVAAAEVKLNHKLASIPRITIAGALDGDGRSINDVTLVFQRTSNDNDANDNYANDDSVVIWHGVAAVAGSTASFVRNALDGSITGTFTTPTYSFSVDTLPDGSTTVIKATAWGDFLDEKVLVWNQDRASAAARIKELGAGAQQEEMTTASDLPVILPNEDPTLIEMESRASLTDATVIDLLVFVTERAMCEYARLDYDNGNCSVANAAHRGPIFQRIPLLQEETTMAMQQVGVNARIRVAGISFLTEDHQLGSASLRYLAQDAGVASLRRKTGADLITMIAGTSRRWCGLAYLDYFVSVASQSCLNGYTFTHEIGHCFGCHHNRDDSGFRHAYAHGYQQLGEFATVMSYTFDCNCTRVPFFSARGYFYQGLPLGDDAHDNARLLRERAPIVAAYMEEKYNATMPQPPPTPHPSSAFSARPSMNRALFASQAPSNL